MTGRSEFSLGTGIVLLVVLLACIVVSATMGYMQVPARDVVMVVWHALTGHGIVPDPIVTAVVVDVRLPRILAAVLVGGVLGVCGTVFSGNSTQSPG